MNLIKSAFNLESYSNFQKESDDKNGKRLEIMIYQLRYVAIPIVINLFLHEMHNSQLVSGHFSRDFSNFWISPVILTEKKRELARLISGIVTLLLRGRHLFLYSVAHSSV